MISCGECGSLESQVCKVAAQLVESRGRMMVLVIWSVQNLPDEAETPPRIGQVEDLDAWIIPPSRYSKMSSLRTQTLFVKGSKVMNHKRRCFHNCLLGYPTTEFLAPLSSGTFLQESAAGFGRSIKQHPFINLSHNPALLKCNICSCICILAIAEP